MWKLNDNFIFKILLIIPALFFYGLLFSSSYISYIQMEYNFPWYQRIYLFTRYVILFSGSVPLFIYIVWVFLYKKNNGFFILIVSIVLHFIVTVFSVHESYTYFILQIIELIFLFMTLIFFKKSSVRSTQDEA